MSMELSSDITEKVLTGITIPPCPASLTHIIREAKRPSTDIDSLAHLISQEAGIVAPLLKLANSPFIGLRSKVTSVFQAISVLGMQNTMNLVQNIALRQSIDGGSQNFKTFWERSSLTATIAEKIASKFPSITKDDAYIAGLFHDCVMPILMMKFPAYHESVMAECKFGKAICDAEFSVCNTSHAVVGSMLARSWMLPDHVSKSILHHHNSTIFTSNDANISCETCDLIGIVHMSEYIANEHLEISDTEWHLYERDILKHFELSEQEFLELKGDALAYLDGE